jgi:hypothetical protein
VRPPQGLNLDVALAALDITDDVDSRLIDLPGGQVVAVSYVDRAEARRRRACGLGPVIDRPLLETLGDLPLGEPIRWDDLDPLAQVQLDAAPTGCVDASPTTVTRLYTPVLDPIVFIAAATGRQAVEEISLFAADAKRLVVGERLPSASVTDEAAQLGIGVAVSADVGFELVVPPNGRFVKPGPRRWFVQERLWAVAPQLSDDQALR